MSSTGVVCNETVAAFDQLDGGFTLADAAVAEDENPLAVDLHKHTVTGDARSQRNVQRGDERGRKFTGRCMGAQEGYAAVVCGLGQLNGGREDWW